MLYNRCAISIFRLKNISLCCLRLPTIAASKRGDKYTYKSHRNRSIFNCIIYGDYFIDKRRYLNYSFIEKRRDLFDIVD